MAALSSNPVLRFTDTIANNTREAENNIARTLAQCVPWTTGRVATIGTVREMEHYQLDAFFQTAPDRLRVERDNTDGDVVHESQVAEFDAGTITVHSGTFQLTSGGANDELVTVAPSLGASWATKAFVLHHSFQNSATGQELGSHNIRSRITGQNEVTLDRFDNEGTADGHWYVIENTAGDEFSVQAISATLTAATSVTLTGGVDFTDFDATKTFLVGSHRSPNAANGSPESSGIHTIRARIVEGSPNTVAIERADGTHNVEWSGFLVTLTNGRVRRGTFDSGTAETLHQATGLSPAMDLDKTIVHIPGVVGSTQGGSFSGTASDDSTDLHVAADLPDTTTVRLQKSTNGGEINYKLAWEIIEFDADPVAESQRVLWR